MSATEAYPRPALASDEENVRIVFAEPTKRGTQLRFACPCGSTHLHGRAEPGDGTTPYRESHCREPGSPLYGIVYKLIEVEPGDPRLAPMPRGRRPIRRSGRP